MSANDPESVMTPVIVPGLAAKRTNGVKDAPTFDDALRGVDEVA